MFRGTIILLTLLGTALAELPPHPRLLMTEASEAKVRARIDSDPFLQKIQQVSITRAEEILKMRTCAYKIPDGKRLLHESRYALENILHCAWAWRMTGDERFLERTILELDAASSLKDWNPSHFLDTAEMCAAVAIGYDWLHDSLTETQRKRYEAAMISKALRPAKEVHDSNGWWTRVRNNWSQVCASGISMGAAAIAEHEPDLANPLLEQGRTLLAGCRVFYEPDGAYPEGPAYWHYGTNYQVLGYAMWEELGRPMEIPEVLHKSGEFMIHLIGPMRLPFNFADARQKIDLPSPAQAWIARHFDDKGQAHSVRQVVDQKLPAMKEKGGRFFPLFLLWMPEQAEITPARPTEAIFHGEQELAAMRTSWNPDAAFLAIKGGTALASHGHMDVGAFVYDAGGVRWFHDLGSDDYNMPGYFGGNRWAYYRLNSLSHNVLTIDGKLQEAVEGIATVSRTGPGNVKLQLDPAYAGQAKSVTRRVAFQKQDGSVRMTDAITEPVGAVRWAAVTTAKVTIDGKNLILEEDGQRLTVSRHDESGGVWEVIDCLPPTAREDQNEGFRMISFTAPKDSELTLEVRWKLEAKLR